MIRIGHGFDVHPLVLGRPCIIGGVLIEHTHGLDGHSDADVLLHAISDAILGASGLGDIGKHFPDNDPANKNINSRISGWHKGSDCCPQNSMYGNVFVNFNNSLVVISLYFFLSYSGFWRKQAIHWRGQRFVISKLIGLL